MLVLGFRISLAGGQKERRMRVALITENKIESDNMIVTIISNNSNTIINKIA